MFLYCDNYVTCNQLIQLLDTQTATDDAARAKGWRVWRGQNMGGASLEVVLCPQCVGHHRAPERDRSVSGEQLTLDMSTLEE